MTHNKINFDDLHSGDTLILKITVVDGDDDKINVEGFDVEYELMKGQSTVLDLDEEDAEWEIVDEESGRIDITIEADATEDLQGKYNHECTMIDGGGNVATTFTGLLTFS